MTLYLTMEMNENNTIYAFSYRIIVYVTKIQLFQSCHPSIKDLNSSKLLYKSLLLYKNKKLLKHIDNERRGKNLVTF